MRIGIAPQIESIYSRKSIESEGQYDQIKDYCSQVWLCLEDFFRCPL